MDILGLLPELSRQEWLLFMLCALLIGMAKAGVKGMGMMAVPILAMVFGGKPSAGLMLPLLSLADVFAVSYYNRHADWYLVWRLLPAAAVGVLIGVWVGTLVTDQEFKALIGGLVVFALILMVLQEKRGLPPELTRSWWFAAVFGVLGGFTTMIGNAAGPIMAVYLLSTRLPKNSFIGTGAWFFMIINWFKFPFHIFVWETITWKSFMLDLSAIPAIAVGVFVGISIVKIIPERTFRYFIMVMTFIIAIRLMI